MKKKQPKIKVEDARLMEQRLSHRYTVSRLSYELNMVSGWERWMMKMPKITVPKGCTFQPAPPFGGAIVRFCLCKGKKQVSVYFDAHGVLGACPKPYWEAYPIKGDNKRYYFDEWKQMMRDIRKELGAKAK